MRYHAPLLCLLAIAVPVCADSNLEYTPFPKPVLKAAPDSSSPSPGVFTPFAARIPQTPGLSKRQAGTCPASNMHICPTGKCCPDGYDCDSNSTDSWCCPTGQTCTGPGSCMVGTTDCRFVNGGDGCCPTATTFCDQDSTGKYGCREITGSGSRSGTCVNAGYYPCADLSGCCETGSTCVPGTNYCQLPCDSGYSECYGGCCPPGYTCDASSQNCKKSSGGSTYTTRISDVEQTSTTHTQRISTKSSADVEPTPDFTYSSITSATTTRGVSIGIAAQTAVATNPNSGSSLRIPVLFGLVVIGLCALVQV